jgi:hypothetical protein
MEGDVMKQVQDNEVRTLLTQVLLVFFELLEFEVKQRKCARISVAAAQLDATQLSELRHN